MPMFSSVWDTVPGLVDKLKALLGGTMSSAQIAKELGNGLSRNAVIGKVGRLGLALAKPKAALSAEKVIRSHTKKTRIHISSPSHPIDQFEVVSSAPAPADLEIPKEQRKNLLSLGPNHCRFPIGEPDELDFFFCGATKEDGISYCKHHAQRCFMPAHRRPPQFVRPQF